MHWSAKSSSVRKVKAVIFAFLLHVFGHPKDQQTHTKEMIMCPRNFVQWNVYKIGLYHLYILYSTYVYDNYIRAANTHFSCVCRVNNCLNGSRLNSYFKITRFYFTQYICNVKILSYIFFVYNKENKAVFIIAEHPTVTDGVQAY